MKALVIPDVHLKPYMFRKADILMERGISENAVCLMDIAMIGISNTMSHYMKKLMMEQYVLQRSIRIHYGVMEIMTLVIFGNVWRRDLAV